MDCQFLYNALINSGISEEQIEKEIRKKLEEFNGYISKEGILFLLAKEHGISLVEEQDKEETIQKNEQEIDYDEFVISLKEVEEGMSNMIVMGRIEKVFGIREFTRKDSSSGKVGSFLLNDGTLTLKVNVWDPHTTIMGQEYFIEKEIIRIINCYAKKNQKTEEIELHTAKKSNVQLGPNDIDLKRFPHFKELILTSPKNKNGTQERFISFSGIVRKIIHFREKDKENGEKSFFLRFVVEGEPLSYTVNVFGMKAVETLLQISEGKRIILSNVKRTYNSYTHQEELYFMKNSLVKVG